MVNFMTPKSIVSNNLDGSFLWRGIRGVCVSTDVHETGVKFKKGCFMKSE